MLCKGKGMIMKRRGSISALFTILNIFLITVVTLAGLIFYMGYLFGASESGVVSVFGYSFFISDESDTQSSVARDTLITSKIIAPQELVNGELVTVIENSGGRFTAYYYESSAGEQRLYLFSKAGSEQTMSLSASQIKSVHLHKYHSDFIGKVFRAFSDNKKTFLISEAALMVILLISLVIVIARRESFRLPKSERREAPPLDINKLITVEHDVEFEHGRDVRKDK